MSLVSGSNIFPFSLLLGNTYIEKVNDRSDVNLTLSQENRFDLKSFFQKRLRVSN